MWKMASIYKIRNISMPDSYLEATLNETND